jgi:uncharacterized membrane protein YhaH (DUF805 family)
VVTDRQVGLLDGAVTATVLAMAWWTVLFHVSVPLDLHRDLVGGLWVAGSALGIGWAARRHGPAIPLALRSVRLPGRAVAALVAVAVGAAALSATRWPDERPQWWLFWLVVVAVTAAALCLVTTGPTEGPLQEPDRSRVSPAAVAVVLLVAVGAAAGSALTQRPDADDVFLVNRSTYVAEHPGPLPERDTLFSDEVFAVTRPDAVPTAIEPLVGVVAAWSPVSAPTVTYLVFGPAVAFLGVLALWRMLRTLGVVAPAMATAAAVGFLLVDGSNHYTFGSMGFVRSWQGKIAFLLVVVPSLWHHGLRWARDGRRADLGWLVAANVAGIGLSTTAVLVGPSVSVVALVAGCWGTGAWRRLLPGLAAAAPAAVAAAAFSLVPRQDPTPVLGWIPPWFTLSGGIEPGRQWHWIYDEGLPLLLPAGAALIAWAFVRDRSARLALLLAPLLLFGFFYGPGTFDAIADVSGVRAILWRTGWILPVPAAVGILVTAPLLLRQRPQLRALASAVAAAAVAAVMLVGGTWVLDEDGGTQGVHLGLGWDVDPTDRAAAQRLIDLSEPGDVVVAPERIGQVIAIQTTRVRAVNPRSQYMDGTHVVPEFLAEERMLLSGAVAAGRITPEQVPAITVALHDLDVRTVCVAADVDAPPLDEALTDAGFAPVAMGASCQIWRRA